MAWVIRGSGRGKRLPYTLFFFFFNDTATTEIYTLSLHDALPICTRASPLTRFFPIEPDRFGRIDRKSTRLNSSHLYISYAVFCLKKKKTTYSLDHTPVAAVGMWRQAAVHRGT